MKKITTTLYLLLSLIYGYGQSIVLLDDNNALISNTTVDVNIASGSSATKEVLITNQGSIPDTIKAIRTIKTIDAGDQTQFCFGGLCYAYSTNVSSLSVIVGAGDTVNFFENGFHALFNAGSACVTRAVHYQFYNIHHSLDTTGVTLRYVCATTDVNELSPETGTISNVYPNPANSLVSVKYDLTESSQKGKIVFYDLLGKAVKEILLNDKQDGIAKINVSDLSQGIYFYSLLMDDKVISTKKLVINR
jgi:hypothetical protein